MRLAIVTLSMFVATSSLAQQPSTEWINGPEAYFATQEERAEWFRLTSDDDREAFQRRYWLLRNPTPGASRNTFKEVILDRIRKADAKFSIKDGLPGSLTAQGTVYIVLGPPAFVRNDPGGGVLPPVVINGRLVPNTMTEATDVITTWVYDTHRTPHLLQMLGRPELQIVIVIEPTRRRDVLQAPGLFDQYRQVLAKRSIVNPQAKVVISPEPDDIVPARLDAPIPQPIRDRMREATPVSRSSDGIAFTAGELWQREGSSAIATFSVPDAGERTTHLTTYGEVRSGDRVVATIAQPFVTNTSVAAAEGSRSEVVRLKLPPGKYDGSFALVDDRTNEVLLNVTAPLRVLDRAAKFDVSSLLLAGPPSSGKSAFSFGAVNVQPRADALFRHDQSLWYFAVIRSSPDAKGVTADLQLRGVGKAIGARTFTPRMDAIAPGTFLLGEELPLTQLTPGDYSLYVVIHGPDGETEVRRADFRVGS